MYTLLEIENNYKKYIHFNHDRSIPLGDTMRAIKLPYTIDPARVLRTVNQYLDTSTWYKKYKITGYTGVSLIGSDPQNVYADEGAPFSLYDKNNRVIQKIEFPHKIHKSPLFEALSFVWSSFPEYQFHNPRLLKLEPGSIVPQHTDGESILNYHLVLSTNDLCGVSVEGDFFHFDADSHIYVVNASKDHFVYNLGLTDRVHLVFNLCLNPD